MGGADDEATREAATDPSLSVLLQAPAGSGKTTVLTQRLLRLLAEVDEPEEILAITFTRKAAAEMRARVAAALRGDRGGGAAGGRLSVLAAAVVARSARRGWNLLEDPGRLSIKTIDAFNFRLAAQLPLAARAGGPLTVTDRSHELYQAAARQTLLLAEEDSELSVDAALLFTRLDNQWRLVETLLASMLEKRAHWLRHVLSHDPDALCARIEASLAHLATTHLATACRVLPAALRKAAAALPGVDPPSGALDALPASLPAWKRLAALTLTARGEWRASRGINRSLGASYADSAARERLREVLETLQGVPGSHAQLTGLAGLPASVMPDGDRRALAALSRVLKVAAAQLQAQLAHSGRVDHTYVGGAARAALADAGLPTEVALRIGFSLRHILVDELQDTSLAQLELLAALTAGWEEGDGRTLFLVGDPMQSIYQFREAEVGLFLKVREQGIGGLRLTPLTLTRNFRAQPALIDWSNRVCAQLFPARDDMRESAVAFTPSRPGRAVPREPTEPVRLALLEGRLAEGSWIAQTIAQLRAREPASTIAVLVAARPHAAPVLAALAQAHIPAVGVDLTPLSGLPVIQDLVALTRALHHLGDRAAWLSVLRAPWCGLTLSSLTALADDLPPGTLLWQALAERNSVLSASERQRLARLRAVLDAALSMRGRKPLADWLEETWVRLGAPDVYPREDLIHARAFFSLLAEEAAGGAWRGPRDLPALLTALYARPAIAGDHPVQIMTIHRAKGLEFDHVLLPGLDRAPASDREPLLRWLDLPRLSDTGSPEEDSDLIMAPVPALDGEAGEVAHYLKDLARRRAAAEQVRLLYVAVTRARDSLHLSASPRRQSDGSVRPRAGTLLERLWPVLGKDFAAAVASPAPVARGTAATTATLRRLPAAWQPAPAPPSVEVSCLPLGAPAPAAVEFSWVGETARHVGTVTHAALCQLAREPQLPKAAQITARRAHIAAQLARLGVPDEELKAATARVLDALRRTLTHKRGRWLLDPAHREARSELSLTGLVDGRLVSVVIDRSFVDASGTRWVLDFKVSHHEGGALAAFLDQEIERYRGQLSRYVTLAQALGSEPVRAALYFPLHSAFRAL